MTAVFDTTPTASADDPTTPMPLASWPARAGAITVDILPGLGVIVTTALLALTAPADGWVRWMFIVALAVTFFLMAANRLVLPVATGWTLGRALFGIAVRRADGRPVGVLRVTGRELAHLLDTLAVFVGWLWPLWDRRRRTFADLLAGTEVYRVERPQRDMRRAVATVLVAAAVASVAAVGLGYALVYRHERAVDTAREQVAAQGPRIVEQMLSYGADTIVDDFARAQALTTDGYRPQLISQQQAVQQAGATTNEYWAVNSAVLTDPPVTPDRVSMLLAMQGQRGTDPNDVKFITATVRVDFEKSADGQWRVANLTVLKKPQMNVAGR
ncbi:RDD family protein [Mycolicibacterium vanbaalenii]|uniref:RDD domain containing protein n=1 Tax=Mycolicibacterium vanbaalenii (strain DSM 7251 / JCM 13017 / BCRC 16820 / KCTC 9966 / NRRL B-24157 / PYR-1) TaxID=350058 RepID=A1T1E2_MYCVP|nr:RDD family protein [Mycolicibacterium vanbaalenii]ABM10992.1 RDD domain containing protein [Mycolicibacterium vanbaalenii PYR-1]MCV7130699.1 RDD family protein [Mycolicibacterium vanbaalenii PYR-1]